MFARLVAALTHKEHGWKTTYVCVCERDVEEKKREFERMSFGNVFSKAFLGSDSELGACISRSL